VSRIAVLTATSWEFKAVASAMTQAEPRAVGHLSCLVGRCEDNDIVLAQTGMGPSAAARGAAAVLAGSPVDLVVSAGYACLLADGQVGDVLTATEVALLSQGAHETAASVQLCDDRFRSTAASVAQTRGKRVHVGRLVSDSRVAVTAEDKRRVAAGTGAVGLDMESAAIAAVAATRNIPMGVLRVASDLNHTDLPLDFNRCTGPFGWAKGAALCLARPSRVLALMAFRRDVAAATASLSETCRAILGHEGIAGPPSSTSRCAEC
jgi:adenosylhomocysteine nucleosidase